MITSHQVVACARSWIGTPFHHAARLKGVGVDCVGLIIGVARELGLVVHDFDVPSYKAKPDKRTMMKLCNQFLNPVKSNPQPGHLIVMALRSYPQHMGIVADHRHGGLSIIHASQFAGVDRVIEHRLVLSMRFQCAAVFSYVGVA